MGEFFSTAAGLIGKLATSLVGKELSDKIKDIRTKRRMDRMVEDAVDRIVEQIDGFLTSESVNARRKGILIGSLCANLQILVDDPPRFFAGNLDGITIFKQCHPNGKLPEEIREEDLGHFYTMLFPQIAHFLAGSRIALAQWEAEGCREEFKRLTQIADEIRAMNVKVADLPTAVTQALRTKLDKEAEAIAREFSQVLLNSLLLRLDLSPLRAERALHGSLRDHFVVPAFKERRENSPIIGEEAAILESLAMPGGRRIVHGSAGIGKTTWSLWLQSRLLVAESSRLAVALRLREIVDIEKRSLLELLRERAGPHLRDALTDRILRKWYAHGRLVIIFDGFDEVPETRRDAVEKWIKTLASVAKKTAIIVTSRPLQSGHLTTLKSPWQQWDCLVFDKPRIVEFIERWHRYLPEGELSSKERNIDATALAVSFLNDPSLKALADTPLMLGTLLFVHHRDKRLPSGRVDLYERYIAAMLGLRDSGMGIQARATKLTDKDKRRVLAHIALHFHLNQTDEVGDKIMGELVAQALEKFKFDENADRLLPALRERTGLLQGPGAWSFTHKTIGEFLVAELVYDGITRLPDKRRLDRKELWMNRHKDAWTSVIFFWAGKTSPRELEDFLQDLLDEANGESTLLALALLRDQGDRLSADTQRLLATTLIQKPLPEEVPDPVTGHAHCVTPVAPLSIYTQKYRAILYPLRGFSILDSVRAFSELFVRGVLVSSDIPNTQGEMQRQLTNAIFRALDRGSDSLTLAISQHLKHLPDRDVALYCLRHYLIHPMRWGPQSIQRHREALKQWQDAFPYGRAWLPVLLAGCFCDESPDKKRNAKQMLGPLLWDIRANEIDDDWLRESSMCSGWFAMRNLDVFNILKTSLEKTTSGDWGIDSQQHAELIVWCNRMMQKRDELTDKKTHATTESFTEKAVTMPTVRSHQLS